MKKIIVLCTIAVFAIASIAIGSKAQASEEKDALSPVIAEIWESVDEYRTPIDPSFKGPNGETVTHDCDSLPLTNAEVEKVRKGNYKVAYSWNTLSSQYFQVWRQGALDAAKFLNMKIIAEASCEFDAAKQLTDIENFIPLKPDVIISSPIDQVGSAQAFRPALDAGIKLAFVSNIPKGYVKGKDYVGLVTCNAYDLGAFGFEMLYDLVGRGGKVAGIFMDTTYWLDNYLTAVFKKKVEESDLELLTWRGYVTYDDALTQANAIISTYPQVQGIWTNWIQSGQAVVNACENAGRKDIIIIAGGYDEPTLLNMIDGKLHGIFSDATYLVGFNSILLAAYGFLGKEGPDYAVGPAVKIHVDNIRKIWASGLRIPFPESVDKALKAIGK